MKHMRNLFYMMIIFIKTLCKHDTDLKIHTINTNIFQKDTTQRFFIFVFKNSFTQMLISLY